MGLYAPGTFSGHYLPHGDPATADFVVIHEFGTRIDDKPGRVNEALAKFFLDNKALHILPIVAGDRAASVLKKHGFDVAYAIPGVSTTMLGKGTGTQGEVAAVRAFMQQTERKRPLVIGQAYHVARIGSQYRAGGIDDFVIPEGLPPIFDPQSAQPWTRNPRLWAIRESIGVPIVHLTGKF